MSLPLSHSPSPSLGITLLVVAISLLSQNDLVSSSSPSPFPSPSSSTAPKLVYTTCITTGAGNYTAHGAYQKNLGNALTTLTSSAIADNATFSNTTVGDGVDEVFALYYCTGEDTAEECGACIQAATAEIVETCPNNKEAIIWYVQCTLRYANRKIFGIKEETPWAYLTSVNKTVHDYNNLGRVLTNTTVEVVQAAVLNTTSNPPNYAWREVGFSATETLVALAQCAPGVTGIPCFECLQKASSNLGQCCILFNYVNMVFLPSCRLLFVVQTSNSTSTSTPAPISNTPVVSSTPSASPTPPESSASSNTSISPRLPSSNNGTLGSGGKILECRNNVITGIALAFIVLYTRSTFILSI